MSSNSRKAIQVLTVGLGLAALVFVYAAKAGRDRPMTVSAIRAMRQNLSSWITSNGKAEPIEPHVIQAQLNTFIEKVYVKEGQAVRSGQTLLTLNATESLSELAHMKEQLVAAEDDRRIALNGGSPADIAQLDNDLAKANFEIARIRREGDSLERLYAKQAATRQEVEQNKAALEKAEADRRLIEQKKDGMSQRSTLSASRASLRVDEARSSIRALEDKENSSRVISPVDGTLYSLPARAGTFVHVGDVLSELADLRKIRVRVFVDEPDLGSLREGQPVEITWDAFPARVWTGKVEQLPKTIVARGSRNVGEAICSVNNDEVSLLPNTTVNVRIRTGERAESLAIARNSVRTEGGKRYVFVVEHGRLRKQEITVGISNATIYEVLTGINEGDLIAIPANAELQDGSPVSVAEQK